jgi:hypothetical protein
VVVVMTVFVGADTSSELPAAVAVKVPKVRRVGEASPGTTERVPPPVPTVKSPRVCWAENPARPRRVKLPEAKERGEAPINEVSVALLAKSRTKLPPWIEVVPV